MLCIPYICRITGNKTLGIVLSLSVGTSFTFLLRFFIFVPSTFVSSIPCLAQFAFTRAFTVIYFCCYMMLWRGWWELLTILTLSGFPLSLLLGLGVSVLFLSCSLASNVGPPLSVSHDSK